MALRYFRQTAAIDLADTHVAIDGGVHIAALGGLWLTAVIGFAGLALRSDGVAIDPQLPTGWSSLSFGLQWRGQHLKIRIDQSKQCLEATLENGEPMRLVVSGTSHELCRNHTPLFSAGTFNWDLVCVIALSGRGRACKVQRRSRGTSGMSSPCSLM